MGSECEIYAGKNNSKQKHVESDSEPSSDVSYSESTDNEEQANKLIKRDLKIEKVETSEKQIKDKESMEKVSKELEQLQVKDVEEK